MVWRGMGGFRGGWDPWTETNRLRREVNRLFEDWEAPYTGARGYPAMNVWLSDESVLVTPIAKVRVNAPGNVLLGLFKYGLGLGQIARHVHLRVFFA